MLNDSGVKLVDYIKTVLSRDKSTEFVAMDVALDVKSFEEETCVSLKSIYESFEFTGLQGLFSLLALIFPSLTLLQNQVSANTALLAVMSTPTRFQICIFQDRKKIQSSRI